MVVSNLEAERLHIIGRAVFFSRIGCNSRSQVTLFVDCGYCWRPKSLEVLWEQSVAMPINVATEHFSGGRGNIVQPSYLK